MAGKMEVGLMTNLKDSAHPDLEGHQSKDLGSVKGNNPHHDDVRARDNYKSKGQLDNSHVVPLV